MPAEHLSQPSTRSNRLAARVRILYVGIPALTVLVLAVIFGLIIREIANDSAQRLARQYSIEAAANFLTNVNPHFVLMQQISRSTTISRWLANEDDPAMKALAFEEIMGYVYFLPDAYVMFSVYETRRAYNFSVDFTLEEFYPRGYVEYGYENQWFFDTRDAETLFILNIQRNWPDEEGDWELHLWTNHRMYYQGRFVGVFTIGSLFDGIFQATFGEFDAANKRGYLVDGNGAVRIDSAMLLQVHEEGLPTFPALPEALENPILSDYINSHLQMMTGGTFLSGIGTADAIRLDRGAYRHGSIAPIIGTGWSVVVLSNYVGIFAGTDLMPLLISTFMVLIFSVIIGNFLMRRIAIEPLFKLAQSVVAASVTDKTELFGLKRDDEIGDLARTVQFMRDSLQTASAELDDTSELNQILIDAAPYVIGLWDDKGNLKSGSPQCMEFFGISDPQMLAKDLYSFSPALQPCGTPTPVKAAMYAEKAYREGYARFEWLHKRTDGELIPAECIYKTFKHRGANLLLSYTIDLREIKAAEAKQREAFEMVNLLLDASPVFIEIWDDKLNLTDCNNRAMELFGLSSKADFIERYESFSPEYQPCGTLSKEKHQALLKQVLTESHAKSEWMHLTASGEELPVEVIYTRLTYHDKHIIVVYNHDLREIKKAMAEIQRIEIVEENSRAKSRFLAKMSHEIRTPISAVLGISEIQLNNSALSLETEEAFAKIYSSANTLLSIVNDILDLSKVEAGKMEIINDQYEVASLLSDVVQLNLAYLGSKKLAFNIDVDENTPAYLTGDELRIKQALNNMLSNAFKYTDKGSVNMKVYAEDGNQSGYVNMVIIIQDTGRGMNEEQLKALFDEYSRFSDKDHRFETGTGLGMSITHALLQLMNAVIDVSSESGKGTTVTITLPQKIVGPEVLGKQTVLNLRNYNTSALSAVKRLSFTPLPMPYGRVLVVDDVDANIYVARGLLALYYLQIDTCSSGIAAVEKIKNGEVYDIIFMDQMMPEMNGMEAAMLIRQMDYTRPIVALTADALVGQAEKFLQNGFDGFLSKPIQTVHLNALLHKFVKDVHPEEDAVVEVPPAASKPGQSIDEYFDNFMEASGINDKIRRDIIRNRKNVMNEVNDALAANDLKTAHRLVHTLKGLVGSIGEKNLFELAEQTEQALRKDIVPVDLLESLGMEMERMLVRIKHHLNEPEEQQTEEPALNNEQTGEVFDNLARLLGENSFDALELCGELAKIPQTSDLISQIEAVDFTLALKTLAELRNDLKV